MTEISKEDIFRLVEEMRGLYTQEKQMDVVLMEWGFSEEAAELMCKMGKTQGEINAFLSGFCLAWYMREQFTDLRSLS